MTASTITSRCQRLHAMVTMLAGILPALAAGSAHAAGCKFTAQGEGRVAEIIDGRSFRLADGREIKLAGIEQVPADTKMADGPATLRAILAGRDVTLSGDDDAPDRYGRQAAFVFLASSDTLVQSLLLAEGAALVSAEVADKDCEGILMTSEAAARQAKKGRLERFYRHKKLGNCRRYFGKDRAICGNRGQDSVRTTSRGNDLSEFRA